jgi:hypothetical protein
VNGQFAGTQINGVEIGSTLVRAGPHGLEFFFADIAFDRLFLSSQNLCAQSVNAGPQVLRTFLATIPPLPLGFGFHSETSLAVSSDCDARADFVTVGGETNISINVKNTGNELRARLTTPGPIPGSLDPKLSIRFDSESHVVIAVPNEDALGHFSIASSQVGIDNVGQVSSENLTGDAVVAARDIFNFLTGDDFLGALRRDRTFTPNITPLPLDPINNAIDQSQSNGKPFRQSFNSENNTLRLDLTLGSQG